MIQDKDKIFLEIHQVLDFALLALAFFLAYYFKVALVPYTFRGLAQNPNYILVFLLCSICCQFSLRFFETYQPYADIQLGQLLVRIGKAILLGMSLAVLTLYITHMADVSRLLMGGSLYLPCCFFLLSREVCLLS